MSRPSFFIRLADWDKDQLLLKQVRKEVFIEEQEVPLELEWDGEDAAARHLIALDAEQRPIGTARLLPSGQIGRMAVIKTWRSQGVGTALLKQLLMEAKSSGYPEPFLNAQLSALPFYAQQGFYPEGEIFQEAGIPHQRMTRRPWNG
ncbi:MAG: GNAT family N-acetyltransferase [Pseudomonadota bacterium]